MTCEKCGDGGYVYDEKPEGAELKACGCPKGAKLARGLLAEFERMNDVPLAMATRQEVTPLCERHSA